MIFCAVSSVAASAAFSGTRPLSTLPAALS
jgi:hypothetical protein